MPAITITNIRLARESREGLCFTVLRKGEAHEFLISREALSDLVEGNPKTEAEMKVAFAAHVDRIQTKAGNALDYRYRAPEGGFILLQTKDFQ
ncbi:DUF1488 family protein [Variovorax paradoxus]|uniref:DUF1488 family protein n=1 Tax=Variovorax paradoxus TaxID=34073 RepID=A0A0H2MLI9_VARPD|nr:DUF1488 family protein [Variovorax paradoxus]KLN57650.1 hypothetical protein VPARA_11630 [Variovorax paradoxus]